MFNQREASAVFYTDLLLHNRSNFQVRFVSGFPFKLFASLLSSFICFFNPFSMF